MHLGVEPTIGANSAEISHAHVPPGGDRKDSFTVVYKVVRCSYICTYWSVDSWQQMHRNAGNSIVKLTSFGLQMVTIKAHKVAQFTLFSIISLRSKISVAKLANPVKVIKSIVHRWIGPVAHVLLHIHIATERQLSKSSKVKKLPALTSKVQSPDFRDAVCGLTALKCVANERTIISD